QFPEIFGSFATSCAPGGRFRLASSLTASARAAARLADAEPPVVAATAPAAANAITAIMSPSLFRNQTLGRTRTRRRHARSRAAAYRGERWISPRHPGRDPQTLRRPTPART